ncbi:MAG: PleD family two-component system response regulator [Vulcanimicrobiota bacterium]
MAGPKVLLIDDDPAVLKVTRDSLEILGTFEVHTASNGQRGLELAHELEPDFIVCDLIMPVVDGREVIARLRADEATRDIPILLLTSVGDVAQALGIEGVEVMDKPFDPMELVARIQAATR